jgi:hypothetical protein
VRCGRLNWRRTKNITWLREEAWSVLEWSNDFQVPLVERQMAVGCQRMLTVLTLQRGFLVPISLTHACGLFAWGFVLRSPTHSCDLFAWGCRAAVDNACMRPVCMGLPCCGRQRMHATRLHGVAALRSSKIAQHLCACKKCRPLIQATAEFFGSRMNRTVGEPSV